MVFKFIALALIAISAIVAFLIGFFLPETKYKDAPMKRVKILVRVRLVCILVILVLLLICIII